MNIHILCGKCDSGLLLPVEGPQFDFQRFGCNNCRFTILVSRQTKTRPPPSSYTMYERVTVNEMEDVE